MLGIRMLVFVLAKDIGNRFTVSNSLSDPGALVVSERLKYTKPTTDHIAICFWVFMNRNQTLGTILSYGEGGEMSSLE